jgi:3-hydroxyacyl-[acyl-carrier-protein] dehydratase
MSSQTPPAVSPVPSGSLPPSTLSNADEAKLRESLKRCSPATYEAALEFRRTRDFSHVPAIVHGIIERYVERELRPKLAGADDTLRLVEDLGLDSLTMMEIVVLAEEVLPISIDNEDLCQLRTLGDVKRQVVALISSLGQAPVAPAAAPPSAA